MIYLPKISAIIVALNEEHLIGQIINDLKKQAYGGKTEIILADGGSTDATVHSAKEFGVEQIVIAKNGKSCQMNAAAQKATGEILFFVHADMRLGMSTFDAIAKAILKGFSGGGFANEFDVENRKIKRLGHWMNLRFINRKEQSDKGIFYGDNGIFVIKEAFVKLNGFRDIPIMEDYEFSKRLGKRYKTVKIEDEKIKVSARRHVKTGFFKTRFQWVMIRKLFLLGIPPSLLAKWYKEVK